MKKKTDWEKTLFNGKVNLAEFMVTLDHLDLDFLPYILKQVVVLVLLLAPILGALACVKYTQEDNKIVPSVKNEEDKNNEDEWAKLIKGKDKSKKN